MQFAISEYNMTGSNVIHNRSSVVGTRSQLGSGRCCDTEVVAVLPVNLLEYSWVTQHHSTSSYPDFWSQPVKLLTEFCQTEDYKSRSATCASSASSKVMPSGVRVSSVDRVVRSKLPASIEPKCSAPHLHRWNPSISADFTDFFHDRIKVLSTGGTIYRC